MESSEDTAMKFMHGYTVALAGALALSPTAHKQAFASRDDPVAAEPIRLTEADVDSSNTKIESAYSALANLWTTTFSEDGARFVTPSLVAYRSSGRTACGIIRPGNASYCPNSNTIYFDDIFVAAQAKRAARELGTDGDMAGIGVIAHEMGHAVAIQKGRLFRTTYRNEAMADCLAGVFAKEADRKGNLEKGDLEEAEYGMYTAGELAPEPTGDPRIDQRRQARYALMSHGSPEQRRGNFRSGFTGGAAACFSQE
jgi:uncharacterized protein